MEQHSISSEIAQITKGSFKAEVIDNETPILIDFWAPWCGPCRAMKPILVEASISMAGQVRVAQVNVDEERELAAAFGIRSIPTCVLIKGDKAIGSFVGVVPARELVAAVVERVAASA